MSTFVLIHGAWHGAWCWNKVVPRLAERGHSVRTVDLPGHGDDETTVSEVTLSAYADRVCDAVAEQEEPVVLVGHSMGGIAITQAAEQIPEKLHGLVYVTAFLLPAGSNLFETAQHDADAIVLPNLVVNEEQGTATLPTDRVGEIFYADCTEEDARFAAERLVPQPLAPFMTPLDHTEQNLGRVPRTYIECSRDRAISLAAQRRMHAALPCRRVVTMESAHSPFFSRPDELAAHLHAVATE